MDKILTIFANPIFWLKQFINPMINKDQTKIFEELIKLFKTKKYKTVFIEKYHTIQFYLRCDEIPEILKPYVLQQIEREVVNLETDYVTLLGYKCKVSLFDTISDSSIFSPKNDGFNRRVLKDYKGIQMDIDIVED